MVSRVRILSFSGFCFYFAKSLTIPLPAVSLHILGFCTTYIYCYSGHEKALLVSPTAGSEIDPGRGGHH